MSILQGKRKRQDLASALSASMTNEERVIYNIIRGKKEMGIWQGDIKRETNIPDSILKKSIKLLISKTLIKEVVNIQNKSKKVLMAMEFEPSKEITGGEWYTEGRLDTQLIDALSDVCLKLISRKKIATRDAILEWTRTLGNEVFPGGVSPGQVEQILKVLVMENKLQEVNSTGFGDFSSVPAGEVCFRWVSSVSIWSSIGNIPFGCFVLWLEMPNPPLGGSACWAMAKSWIDVQVDLEITRSQPGGIVQHLDM
ncbi:DNA-directed RNA polymerase III subunit RPC6 isoform X1 [Vigna angularis]|uniref:DNA-directed RNA polymerase III subunit RPC6 isoform X1 n=1 Tax=Phaseolus angularis TaxID=3914 RepID=UPI0022B58485|nr:DNA-directed RNA polymerase III subunit RPC6 isoform X1 [Vigna angularis]XP_052724475.1 DNA-directed RNA polymerase III subunit RPC6 isoform X1 [Vigna angularis]